MPRTIPVKQFIINRLRYVALSKKTSPATAIRALDRLATLEGLYAVELREQEPGSEKPENLSGPGLNDTIEAMLERVRQNAKRGVADAKLPNSEPSGS